MRPLMSFCCQRLMVFIFTCSYFMANGEFYSSVERLKVLANMEAEIIQNFRQELELQKQEIESFQRFIEDVKFQHELAKMDVNKYIGNPVNAFRLIKRVVYDWNYLFESVVFPDFKIDIEMFSTQFKEEFLQLPDDSELKGAVEGLRRLQTVYKLHADAMAKGEKYGKPLDWHDCFTIGTNLLDYSSFYLAIDWLKQSHLKLQDSEETDDMKLTFTTHIKEYLALAYQAIGRSKTAVKHLDDVLENDPSSSVKLTKNILLNIQTYISSGEDLTNEINDDTARLCRGESYTNLQQLKCKLDSKLHPFFILSPVQVEPLLDNPPITLYHNLINDDQISKLLSLTHNKMQRSGVVDEHGRILIRTSRVSQQMPVGSGTSNITKMMYKIMGAITGFDLNNAEDLKIAFYGIGGQYIQHHDYFGYTEYPHNYVGDRISTNMFYLSDVDEGGFTIFPILDVYVKPVKGAMLMWYNLHKSLDVDARTLHAGCPVLKGNKKIANIWTHSGYQEFRRPCGLKNDKIDTCKFNYLN